MSPRSTPEERPTWVHWAMAPFVLLRNIAFTIVAGQIFTFPILALPLWAALIAEWFGIDCPACLSFVSPGPEEPWILGARIYVTLFTTVAAAMWTVGVVTHKPLPWHGIRLVFGVAWVIQVVLATIGFFGLLPETFTSALPDSTMEFLVFSPFLGLGALVAGQERWSLSQLKANRHTMPPHSPHVRS